MALTRQREEFAQAYVELGNASEAYRRAYPASLNWKPATVHSRASELLANSEVMGRIKALQAEHRRRHDVTVDSLTADAYRAIELAQQEGQVGAMVSALQFVAKLHGLMIDKHAVKGSVEHRGTVDVGGNILDVLKKRYGGHG